MRNRIQLKFMRECLLLQATLVTLVSPVFVLITDRILGFPAQVVLLISLPFLFLLFVIFFYTYRIKHGLSCLILCGLIGGILGTVALDAVRLIGVKMGAFPMDMPRMFGIIASGKAPQFQMNTMAVIVQFIANLREDQRKAEMRRRVHFLVSLDETSRRAFMGAMLKGLEALPAEKRAAMVDTQMSLLLELDPEQSRIMMDSMSALTMIGSPGKFPSGIELFLKVPQVPMEKFRKAVEVSYPQTLKESGLSDLQVAVLGYLWHFMIGSTFGIAYTLLFGRGRWLWAFGWGAFVWLAMMVMMPVMMPMIDFPWWFPVVPFVAHMAMAVPIGWVALRFVNEQADGKSFIGLLRQEMRLAVTDGTGQLGQNQG